MNKAYEEEYQRQLDALDAMPGGAQGAKPDMTDFVYQTRKPNWLICNNCYTDGNPEKLRDAAIKQGCEVNWFRYTPFEFDKNQDLGFDKNSCTIGYGSIQLSKLIQRKTNWTPGVWVDWNNLKCSNYLTYWGELSIHQNYAFLPLGAFIRRKEEIFSKYSKNGVIFIKPDDNVKSFHGEVVAYENYDRWLKEILCNDPDMTLMCLISEPTKIAREWRTVVANGEFITGSQYRELINGESSVEVKPDCPKAVARFAEKVSRSSTKYDPAPIYCIDICEDLAGKLHLLEMGGLNCAGLYDCDMEKIVEVANEIAIKNWEDING